MRGAGNSRLLCVQNTLVMIDVQKVRLLDVFVIAPVLMVASTQKTLSKPMRLAVFSIGLATLLYNGHNYLKNK